MIIVKLMGGIGNTLFQYAIGKAQAKKFNTDLKLDIEYLVNCPQGWTKYGYELEPFEGVCEETIVGGRGLKKVDEDPTRIYKTYPINNNNHLEGYWQSEKYFEDIKEELKNILVFRKDSVVDKAFEENSVSIHARRGDYLNGDHFVNLSTTDYYSRSIEEILKHVKNPKFYIFSNDVKWAKEYFKFINQEKEFEKNSTIQDLYLMSKCNYNITANSTYSWWAAWLNKNENKIVVSPRKWFSRIPTYNERYLKGSILI